jgi:hypothetical protein
MSGITSLFFAIALIAAPASAPAAKSKPGKVQFLSPKDGATVPATFKVKFGVTGKKIRPAGEAPDEKTSGHHHLLVDKGPIPEGQVIPADETHLHYGKGQTEAEVKLPPGEHTLTMQFADGLHRSYGEKMSATIKVKVQENGLTP